ncbi:RDD family protein [Kitasatospora camelliae]|uniref:RDD family protein n=1 Tax=Kitasatospora camelliae TaxID=3156397 RepID=A0AAU8K0A8_9ACTN
MSVTHRPDPGAARVTPHALRIAAIAADLLLVLALTLLPGAAVALAAGRAGGAVPAVLAFLLVYLLGLVGAHATQVWLTGRTAGKAMFGLRVVRTDGSAPPPTARGLLWAVGRPSVGYLLVDVFGLGALAALGDRRHRCVHDLVFGSEVRLTAGADGASPGTPARRLRDHRQDLKASAAAARQRHGPAVAPWIWQADLIALTLTGCLFLAARIPLRTRPAPAGDTPPPRWSDRQATAAPAVADTPVGSLSRAGTAVLAVGLSAVTLAVGTYIGQRLAPAETPGTAGTAGVASPVGDRAGTAPSGAATSAIPQPSASPSAGGGPVPTAGTYLGTGVAAAVQLRLDPAGPDAYRVTLTRAGTPALDPVGCTQDLGPPTDPAAATVNGSGGHYEGLAVSADRVKDACFYQVQQVVLHVLDPTTVALCSPTADECPTYRHTP